jgi:hypothetical protein
VSVNNHAKDFAPRAALALKALLDQEPCRALLDDASGRPSGVAKRSLH